MKILTSSLIVLFILSVNLMAQGEMDDATKKIYNEGNKSMKAGDFQGAILKYDEALKTSQDYRIYYQKGITLKKMNKNKDAVEAFLNATKSNPKSEISYNGLGSTYHRTGQYVLAIEAYKKFYELATKQVYKDKANSNISLSYTELAKAAKADADYDKAIGYALEAVSHKNYDSAYLILAEAYYQNTNYTKVLEAADNALNYRKTITKGGPHYYKGLAFLKLGEKDKAKEAFLEGKKDKTYAENCKYELKNSNF